MKKRMTALGLVLMMLLVWGASLAASNTMQEGSMYVNTANGRALRFRTTKSTKGTDNVMAEIPYGTKVYVTEWDGTWARVRYNGTMGYVVQKHLSIARPRDYAEVVAEREAEKEAQEALKEAQEALKAAEAEEKRLREEQEAAERLRLAQLARESEELDQSALKAVDIYDVSVVVGVVDMTTCLYAEPKLTAEVLAEYGDGARLAVLAENEDWARVYDGATDQVGYMLREDLIPDLEEEIMLED